MKNLNTILKLILVLFLSISFYSSSFSRDFTPASDVSNKTIDKSQKTFKFRLMVFRDTEGLTDDDNLYDVEVSIGGVHYFDVNCEDEFTNPNTGLNPSFDLNNEDESTFWINNIAGTNISVTAQTIGDFGYLDFEVDLVSSQYYSSSLHLEFDNFSFDDGGTNDYDDDYLSLGYITGWEVIEISSFSASNNSCNTVDLNWDLNSGEINDVIFKIQANGSNIFTGSNISSTVDFISNPSPNPINYTLFAGYSSALIGLDTKDTIGGPPRDQFDVPTNFTATNHSCDSILLEWDHGTNVFDVFNYRIVRNPGNVEYLVDNTDNSYVIYNNGVSGSFSQSNYNFEIRSVSGCGFNSVTADYATSNFIPLDSAKNLTITELSSGAIQLNWIDALNEAQYEIIKTSTLSSITIPINKNVISYIDSNIQSCEPYSYQIRSLNNCNAVGLLSNMVSYTSDPDLSNTFQNNDFRVSKGYHSDKVRLEWSVANNGSIIENYKIYRKILNASGGFTLITTIAGNTLNSFDDLNTDAGVLYHYKILGEILCNNVIEKSDSLIAIGFRSAFGTVTGQVNYTGGIAVEDVKISAESTSGNSGNSLQFDGNGYIAINNNNYNSNNLTVEFWLKPDGTNTSDFTLFEKAGQYSFKRTGANYIFEVPSVGTIQFDSSLISSTQHSQITATVSADSIELFVNGLQKTSLPIGSGINIGTDSLKIGENYIGLIDEFRLWNIGKSNEDVLKDFSRQLKGSETDLKIYLKMNEGLGDFAYDFSKSTITNFNKNHAKINGGVSWSSSVPPANQLKLASYTNNIGIYELIVPFSGNGETFTITPSYLTHNFTPSTQALFLGDGSYIQNNINFEDISSFTVQGSLFYANTSCAVENASLRIDGNPVYLNGEEIKTDAQGNFVMQVPIGNHYITIEKPGHIMNVGRFPEFGTYDFQDDLAGISFLDTTLVKVVGRVVGGLKEAQYLPMNGRSKNNIGQAQIILKSQQGNGCYTDTILTIDTTGEYSTYLPPLKYVPTVDIINNPIIDFGVLDLVDLTDATTLITETDSFFNSNNNLYSLDTISFNKQLDYIYRNTPVIVVKETDLNRDFRGDTSYSYIHPNGSEITRNLITDPLPWPVFNGIQDPNKLYTCLITAYEPYSNIDDPLNPILDTVPVTDGTVMFNNNLCLSPGGQVELSDINSLNDLNYIYYEFQIGTPNFNENINIPEYNFVKTFEINVLFPDGNSIPWKPNVYNGSFTGQFANAYDNIFRGYVLGTKADGNQFITEGPQVPEFILRDPPGSNSYSAREVGSSNTTENTWSWAAGGSVSSTDKIFTGTRIFSGVGVAIDTDIESNSIAGFSANINGGNSGVESVTITNTQEWATNSNTDLPGKGSDLYIGKSRNVTFGIATTLKIVPDSICTQVECLGTPFSSLSFSNSYGISIVPGGYATQFIYNEDHIKTYLIPELIQLRNAILQTNTKYNVPNYSITDPNYGLNNDDHRVVGTNGFTPNEYAEYLLQIPDSIYSKYIVTYGSVEHCSPSQAQQAKWDYFNRYNNPDSTQILSGYSYTYNANSKQDSLSGDSVRFINNQIRHWEEAILLNEWEKVNIDNASIKQRLAGRERKKVYDEYQTAIEAYLSLNVTGGAAGGVLGLAAVVTPVPGGAFAGYASFAVTSGSQIAANEVYEEVLQYESQMQLIQSRYIQTAANYSISGGTTLSSSISHDASSSYTKSVEFGMDASLDFELAAKVNNIGTGLTRSGSLSFESSKNWSTAENSTEVVSFTLDEPDQGDYFSVDVFPSLLGWGPIFKLRAGGRTSCPHEDAQLTEYYTEDPANPSSSQYAPFYPLGERTLQRDKPTISAAPTLLTNVPIADAAVFNLTLNNESESNDPREYRVALHSPSNPFGAIVRIDGLSFADLSIPPLSSLNKVLTVNKGPGPVYNYDSLLVLIYAPCQYAAGTSDNVDIVDSVYISAHFLPTCTDVNFATPDDQWVLNNSFQDTMPISMIDYNINFYDFNSIRLDYKPSSQSNWTGLKTFYKDTTGLNNPFAEEIPTITPFTLWNWETNQLVDGDYDLRLVTQCALSDKISPIHTGVMDRINPHPFGTPSPADGILDPNDDIYIKFNEPVDLGSLTSLNFDVRGVINGSETTHASNLFFDGIDDYVEVTGGANLQKRDFTIEFSVKRDPANLGKKVILSQGTDNDEQLYVGFDAANHLEFKINGTSLTSFNIFTDNEWHYFAIAYDYENETADMYEASGSSTASTINPGGNTINANYEGDDKLFIGKDGADPTNFFQGNIDDVRIWNVTRSLNEFSLTKSTLLSSNQLGLLYNWRFDDANSIIAEDHVRARNAILKGAEWTIEPGGNAVTFDAVTNNYLKVQKGDVNITQGMDFTLEFWFNSDQSGPSTLVSNGLADGIGADSLYSWNINKDASGLIHVLHNGIDFLATDSNYFDGEWHHFALVLNRLSSLTSYIDGNLQKSMPATNIREFGAPFLYIGAKGYLVGATETIDSYFDGQMDEFRFWNASRKYEQIERDQHNRMKGDEFALKLYLPFEDYQLDPTNIPILTPSFDEQIDLTDTVHIVSNPNTAVLNTSGPKIKIQRPIESIAHTYSVNGDEIIITPTTNPALIENVTLDITVKNVKDLHGNIMESPKTWIAYMDKNQVVWQDDFFNFYKPYGDALSFSSQVVNNGGAAKDFDIENLPSWLSADIVSGTIAPNSAITVNFEVDSLINIGDYTQDIHLITDFGFPEKLGIDLTVREQEPNWNVNPNDFDYSMNIIGYLKIKDIVSSSDEDMLAAFVGEECRGKAHLQYEPLIDRYLVFLDVYSNVSNGENLTFQIWDASSGVRYSDVTPSIIPFQENTLIGTISAPQLFETNYEVIVDVPLVSGWNWVSNFLFNKDSMKIDTTLESLESVLDDEIKGQGNDEGVSKYTGSVNGWQGSLNGIGIRPENAYKLQISKTDTLVLKGDILDPTSRTIDIDTGWNWIGFISLRNQSVKEALGNLNAVNGDLIKGQSQFAVYDSILGWVGSLQTMIPGQGYMYKSEDDKSFVYPFAGNFKSGLLSINKPYQNKVWTVDYGKYRSNMTAITKVISDCDDIFLEGDYAIGVFDNNNLCRGLNPILLDDNNGLSFLTSSGNNSENLNIRIVNNSNSMVYYLKENLTYQSNTHIGDLENPFQIEINNEICKKMEIDEIVIENVDEFIVYPSEIEESLTLEFFAKEEDLKSEVKLLNILGQTVYTSEIEITEGANKVSIDVSSLNLPKGIYHFNFKSGEVSEKIKLISKK